MRTTTWLRNQVEKMFYNWKVGLKLDLQQIYFGLVLIYDFLHIMFYLKVRFVASMKQNVAHC